MKKLSRISTMQIILPCMIALILASAGLMYRIHSGRPVTDDRKNYEAFLNKLNRKAPVHKNGVNREEPAADEPGIAEYHDFLMTLDPGTGRVPRERLVAAMNQTGSLAALKQGNTIHWQGYPSDMGGRTRTIMYDPNDATHKKVWAGGVTGGLWYNNNISSATSPWVPVNDFWSNLAVRCITYDPANPLIFYLGTGEAETALQTYRESSGLGRGLCVVPTAGKPGHLSRERNSLPT